MVHNVITVAMPIPVPLLRFVMNMAVRKYHCLGLLKASSDVRCSRHNAPSNQREAENQAKKTTRYTGSKRHQMRKPRRFMPSCPVL